MIMYFTGTGNSRYVAERLAVVTGDAVESINDRIKSGNSRAVCADGRLVIVTPTYAWRIPHIVLDWLMRTEISGTKSLRFVMTCGADIGNAGKLNRKLCGKLGLEYLGTAAVVMPENYIAMFSVPEKDEAMKIIEAAEPVIENLARTIVSGEKFPVDKAGFTDVLKSGPVNRGFYSFNVKTGPFRVKDGCVGCGKCASVCPLGNIEIMDRKPIWGGKCTHCMACISLCPEEAIEYGSKSVGKPRYHI